MPKFSTILSTLALTFATSSYAALPSVIELPREIEAEMASEDQNAQLHMDAAEHDARSSVQVANIGGFAPDTSTSRAGRCRTMGGVASYYGPGFHGRPTASGERFNSGALTAAHRTLPFGSMVRVQNRANGRTVMVRINDRGPFHGGRVIDLSAAAARHIGMGGVAPVTLETCL